MTRDQLTEIAYEVPNTFSPDTTLDEQIAEGSCDWRIDLPDGSVHFGHSLPEVVDNAFGYIGLDR